MAKTRDLIIDLIKPGFIQTTEVDNKSLSQLLYEKYMETGDKNIYIRPEYTKSGNWEVVSPAKVTIRKNSKAVANKRIMARLEKLFCFDRLDNSAIKTTPTKAKKSLAQTDDSCISNLSVATNLLFEEFEKATKSDVFEWRIDYGKRISQMLGYGK